MKHISTSALANKLNVEPIDMFLCLEEMKWIRGEKKVWNLTELGVENGGKIQNTKKYGKYIVWPEESTIKTLLNRNIITATNIKSHFSILLETELIWCCQSLGGLKSTKTKVEKKAGK